MAILAECPRCKTRQSVSNKLCKCGEKMDPAKRANRVRCWISYRLPTGKQRTEPVGFSIEDARAADGKRKSQKKEGRIFDMMPDSKRFIYLRAGDTKEARSKLVPISKPLRDIIMQLPGRGDGGIVFKYYGHGMMDITQGMAAGCKDAEIVYGRFKPQGFVFHDLRTVLPRMPGGQGSRRTSSWRLWVTPQGMT